MAQDSATYGVIPPGDSIGNEAYVAGADVSADVNGIDLTRADYWYVKAKIIVTANGGTLTVALFMSDASNGTGNVHYITPVMTIPSSGLGTFVLEGMGNRSQQYCNIDFTIGTSVTADYEVWGRSVATRSA